MDMLDAVAHRDRIEALGREARVEQSAAMHRESLAARQLDRTWVEIQAFRLPAERIHVLEEPAAPASHVEQPPRRTCEPHDGKVEFRCAPRIQPGEPAQDPVSDSRGLLVAEMV